MLRIGLIGTGTVGGGVIQILEQKIAEYKEKLGVELELACICAKSEEEVAPYKAKGYKVSMCSWNLPVATTCRASGSLRLSMPVSTW